jgi:periplasmic divalent cation tolerance protein
MDWKYVVVLITVPTDKGLEIADYIVKNKLGACVNVVPEVNSIYWWKGNIERDKESLLVIKTSLQKLEGLDKRSKECPSLHGSRDHSPSHSGRERRLP